MNEIAESQPPVPVSWEATQLYQRAQRVPSSILARVVNGGAAFFRGLGYLVRHPRLWPLVILPFVINVLLFVVLAIWLWGEFAQLRDYWFDQIDPGAGFWGTLLGWAAVGGEWLVTMLFWVLYAFAVYFLFIAVGTAVAGPFSEMISASIEKNVIPQYRQEGRKVHGLIVDALLAAWHAIIIFIIFAPAIVVAMLTAFLPVIGVIISPILLFLVAVPLFTWTGMDFSLTRRRLSFFQKWRYYRRHAGRVVGLGTVSYFMFWIPFLGILVFQICVAGGTLLFAEIACGTGDTGEPAGESSSGGSA